MQPFAVMAKPVGSRCNMGCTYCYYLSAGTEGAMSGALLEAYTRQYIEASPGPVIQFTWHGGEPTLAGIDFYRQAVALQKKYLPKGWTCWNNLQTNGLLIDDEWCLFLKENHFDVGSSGTHSRAARAVNLLKKHGIRPDLLCTVTALAAQNPLGVYRALRRLETGWVQFIPIVVPTESGISRESVSADGYGQFLCAIFDEWILHDLGKLDVQLFAECAMILAGGQASLCWMAPTCGRVLIVERDGGVYSCDHFVDAEHLIGSILTDTLSDLLDLPAQRAFGEDKRDALPARCRTCRWLKLCNGGCPKDRILPSMDGGANLNHLCAGLEKFFAHAEGRLKSLVDMKRRGIPPGAMMEFFRGELREKWRGVGPNDPCICGSGKKAKRCCWSKRG